jgi:hypothetical protein
MATLSQGFSREARFVARKIRRGRRHLWSSNTLGGVAMDELGTVWSDCSVPNWDGYEAVAVTQDTLRNAYLVLESLPAGFPIPSIGAEADGAITLDWHRSPRRTVSISVDESSDLHYAALLGPNQQFGTEVFSGELPERIMALVEEVSAYDRPRKCA